MQKEDLIKKCGNLVQMDRYEIVQSICEILQFTKTQLVLKSDFTDSEVKKVISVFKKLKDIPLANILHRANFYGYDFCVNKNVLTPRQDSELIVFLADKVLKNKGKTNLKVLDLCCGSGCLGLTLKKLNDNINLTLADISKKALEITKTNSEILQLNCNIVNSDMFNHISGGFDCIISNPPYIKTNDIELLEDNVKKYDPIIALDGKEDGLYFYREIANSVLKFLNKNGVLICEIGYDQAESVKEIFDKIFKDVKIYKDNGGNDRAIICKDRRIIC